GRIQSVMRSPSTTALQKFLGLQEKPERVPTGLCMKEPQECSRMAPLSDGAVNLLMSNELDHGPVEAVERSCRMEVVAARNANYNHLHSVQSRVPFPPPQPHTTPIPPKYMKPNCNCHQAYNQSHLCNIQC
ncbi:hypothetical protein ACTXT7_017163, partial [Hymenolepis weldensis]